MSLNNTTLIPLFDLTDDEKEMVLRWRNDDNVRKWMYTSDIILKENHFKFIDTLANNKNNKYFLVKKENENLGVIYFNDISETTCEFGLYTNVEVNGVGKILLTCIFEYAFNELGLDGVFAEVFQENKKAIALYEKYSLKKIDTKIVKNKKVICMELKNENR